MLLAICVLSIATGCSADKIANHTEEAIFLHNQPTNNSTEDLLDPNQSSDIAEAAQPTTPLSVTMPEQEFDQMQPAINGEDKLTEQNQSPDITKPTTPTDDMSTSTPELSEATKDTEAHNQMNNNCKLIVKGKDITSASYVYLDEVNHDVEIPLTAVVKALGAKVRWENKTTVIITFDGDDFILDIAKQDFGLPLPPGATHFARKIIGKEVVIDSTSATGLISHWMGAKIKIDFDKKIVEIG